MAAVVADARPWLGYSGRVESNQYFRALIRIPDTVRAHVSAGAEDSRPDTKSLWSQPRWAIRARMAARNAARCALRVGSPPWIPLS